MFLLGVAHYSQGLIGENWETSLKAFEVVTARQFNQLRKYAPAFQWTFSLKCLPRWAWWCCSAWWVSYYCAVYGALLGKHLCESGQISHSQNACLAQFVKWMENERGSTSFFFLLCFFYRLCSAHFSKGSSKIHQRNNGWKCLPPVHFLYHSGDQRPQHSVDFRRQVLDDSTAGR